MFKWIQHVCRLCSFKPQWLSTMGPIRFSHSTKTIPFQRMCMNSMNSIGKIKRMKGAKRNKSNKYYRVDTDFFLYVLCYLHPFYLFIFLFMQPLSPSTPSLIVNSKMFAMCSVQIQTFPSYGSLVHTRARGQSICIYFVSVIILYSIWIYSDLFVHHIFIYIFVCPVLSHKVHTTHSLSVSGFRGWEKREKNSQLKHILLDQHKIHIATKSFVHWKMMPRQRCEKKSQQQHHTHTITTSTSKQFFSLAQIFTISQYFSESIYSILCMGTWHEGACIPYLSLIIYAAMY